MKAAAGKTGLEIDWRPLPIGRSAHETHGHTVPASTVEALRSADGWVLGPMGHNAYKDVDIVVTTNLFGDILTDEGAGLVGGLGLAPGLCVGEHHAMAQATHGSAPDIAGKGKATTVQMGDAAAHALRTFA